MTNKLINRALGYRDPRSEGIRRSLRGFREGDTRELYLGLTLTAFAYLRRSTPKKTLLHREVVPEGSAIVVHHRKSGGARLTITKPKR